MRLLLALGVIGCHTIDTSYAFDAHQQALAATWRPLVASILPMFFALSGFLVAGSLERCRTLFSFIGLRVLRIMPALVGEVLLSAFILGPMFTVFSLRAYFRDHAFIAYFLNILGDIHYRLPGVFLDNPSPAIVNGQLWTVPYELGCYVLLTIIAVIGIVRKRNWLLLFMLGLYALQAFKVVYDLHAVAEEKTLYGAISGRTLIMVFIAGLALYRCRTQIPLTRSLFVASIVLSATLFCLPPHGERFVALPVAYLTVYFGLMNPARTWLIGGDYSYGLFLYGYPLQQAVASLGPGFHHWYWNLAGALPCAALCAYLSWRFIEKPALALRVPLRALESTYLRRSVIA